MARTRTRSQRSGRSALWSGLVALAILAAAGRPGPAMAQKSPAYQNPALPLDVRVNDLVSRLTLAEKISILHQYQVAIPRLGMPLFKTGTEALHGVAWSCDYNNGGAVVTAVATVFPQALGLASTWDTDLIHKVGNVVGTEARGLNAQNPVVWGLNLWAPVVNLLRDPRWGRNEEGYSEDPFLTGAISVAYGKGIEGNDPRHLLAAPTLKHYLAYNNEVRRDVTSSSASPRVLNEYDRLAFKAAIQADAATGVMPSYNLVNGRPNTVSADLNEVIRGWTRTPLMIVSDAWAPYNLTGSEAYYATQPEADAAAIRAGLDSFTMDDNKPDNTVAQIQAALDAGLLTEKDIDTAAGHNLSIRFRLGEFDPPGVNPYVKIGPEAVNTPEHQQLARKTAQEAMVLLKNAKGTLPLDASRIKKIAVIGPLANTLYTDWYSGALPYQVTPYTGIQARLGSAAQVVVSEASDRIALREVTSNKYVTASEDPAGAILTASGDTAGADQSFDVYDWGEGVVTLKAAANARYVNRSWSGGVLVNSESQPNGWFVMQQFKLDLQPDGTYVLEYAGYEVRESWYDGSKYVVVDPATGQLAVTAKSADTASRFTREVLVSGKDTAIQAASGADAAVVVVGSMPFINGRENRDRVNLDLAPAQEDVLKAVLAANPRTIMVLENSYPTAINWENENVPAILWTTHAGQETGRALADILFGDAAPAGRLTQTWYKSLDGMPDILDYDIIQSDRTYLYFKGTPLYPFGYGLTYTSFAYRNLRLSVPAAAPAGTVTVSVDVTNTGSRAGDEVVQLYTHQRSSRVKQPVKALRSFERIHLAPGETRSVRLRLPVEDLAFWDVTRERMVVEASVHDVMVGRSSADIRLSAPLAVFGEVIPPRDLTRPTRAENFDASQGIVLVDESKVRGTAVGSSAAGNWIKFQQVDLQRGLRSFTAQVAKEDVGSSEIQLRLDDPVTGPVVGKAQVTSTGSRYTYAATTAAVQAGRGVHDLYLVFADAGTRVSTFQLARR